MRARGLIIDNMAEIEESLKKQKESLIILIRESSKREKDRLKRLTTVKRNEEHEQLLKRFKLERAIDQERVEHLTNDYLLLRSKYQNGELQQVKEERVKILEETGGKKEVIPELLPNRFVGLEDRNGQIFYTDCIKKFDNHDMKFQLQRSKQPFDIRQETRKLKLLTEKKELLNRLISIQSQENKAKNVIAPFSITSSQYAARRQNDQRSIYSDQVSSITAASYATFATNKVAQHQNRKGPPSVPRLQLPGK